MHACIHTYIHSYIYSVFIPTLVKACAHLAREYTPNPVVTRRSHGSSEVTR